MLIFNYKIITILEVSFSGKGLSQKFIKPKTKIHIKREGGDRRSTFFDVLKSPNCVLIYPQTTILAIIGVQLMQSFNRNSPLWGGGHKVTIHGQSSMKIKIEK